MAKGRKAPVKLQCKPGAVKNIKVCRWTCPKGNSTVQFKHRRHPNLTAVLHPSLNPGKWRVSTFDERGAVGHVERASCELALRDADIGRAWKLVAVVGRASNLSGLGRRRRRKR